MVERLAALEGLRRELAAVRRDIAALRADLAVPPIVSIEEFVRVVAVAVEGHVFTAGELLMAATVHPDVRRVLTRFASPSALGNYLAFVAAHPPDGWHLRAIDRDAGGVIWELTATV